MNRMLRPMLVIFLAAYMSIAHAARSCEPVQIWLCASYPDLLAFDPPVVTFPATPLGTIATQVVSITNVSSDNYEFYSLGIASLPSRFSVTSSCPAVLAPGATCSATLRFSPMASGPDSAVLTARSIHWPQLPAWAQRVIIQDMQLSGTGTGGSQGRIEATPPTVTFGAQRIGSRGDAVPVRFTNTGTSAVSFNSVHITGDFGIEAAGCPTQIAPGATCEISVFFAPSSTGNQRGALSIETDSADPMVNVTLEGTGVPVPSTANFTGLWWYPAESGWGLTLAHQDDTMFAALFTYSGSAAAWYAAPALRWQADGRYSGTLYIAASGPPFDASSWNGVQLDPAGDISVTPLANGNLQLRYQMGNAPAIERTITRVAFAAPLPVCSTGPRGRAAQANYQDLWWNSSENGWGVNLAHQGNLLFANVYTFDAQGRNAWYFASALELRADGSFAGGLYEATLPQSPAGQWPAIVVRQVGTMSARFTDGEHGHLTFSIDGRSAEKNIERLVFGAHVAWCSEPAS